MQEKSINISDFDYPLPDERIAKFPLEERSSSKLLIYNRGEISHRQFANLGEVLPEGTLLVFNNTKVVRARLVMHKESGARIEVFCLEPHAPADYEHAFAVKGSAEWSCIVGNLKKWKSGEVAIHFDHEGAACSLRATITERGTREHIVRFEWDADMLPTVARLNIPYVLTHSAGWAGTPVEYDCFLPQVLASLAKKLWQLRSLGVKDVVVDPGFGFGKSIEQNYEMLSSLAVFAELEAPLLVGLSRKSMMTKLLGISPSEALPETSALNMVALQGGAHILRVHDVREAVNVVKMFGALKGVS